MLWVGVPQGHGGWHQEDGNDQRVRDRDSSGDAEPLGHCQGREHQHAEPEVIAEPSSADPVADSVWLVASQGLGSESSRERWIMWML